MLLETLKKLDSDEIREMIIKTDGEERRFYVDLHNKVLELRQIDTLNNEKKYGNYNKRRDYQKE